MKMWQKITFEGMRGYQMAKRNIYTMFLLSTCVVLLSLLWMTLMEAILITFYQSLWYRKNLFPELVSRLVHNQKLIKGLW